jgi:hypothetical protein
LGIRFTTDIIRGDYRHSVDYPLAQLHPDGKPKELVAKVASEREPELPTIIFEHERSD